MNINIIKKIALSVLFIVMSLLQAQAASEKDYDEVLARYVETTGPGVTVIMTQNGKTLYKQARGLANIELQVP